MEAEEFAEDAECRLDSNCSDSDDVQDGNDHDDGDDDDGDDDDHDDDDDLSEDLVAAEASQVADPPAGCVRIRPSLFRNLPATIFFEYPTHLGMSRQEPSQVVKVKTASAPSFRCYWERRVVKDAFLRAGFKRTKSGNSWNGLWEKHLPKDQLEALSANQKVNHFPGSWCIGRKDRLLRTLQKFKRTHPGDPISFPEAYILPAERATVARHLQQQPDALFIMKPVASSCGRGINIVHSGNFDAIPKGKKAILQRYVKRPYLIHNKKFDLRIYVLVTSVDPLRVCMFEEGLVRFSTETYTLKNLKNRRIHITNFSVHKHSATFAQDVGEQEGVCGHKWSLQALKCFLAKEHGEEVVQRMMQDIEALIIKTMIAAANEIAPSVYKHCHRHAAYELFGCDILLDRHLKPWLLEVNVSPSLMASSPLDLRIKGMLLADTLHLVGHFHKLRKTDKAYITTNFLQQSLRGQDRWRQTHDVGSVVLQSLTPDDFRLMLEIEDEWARRGHFKPLYPVKETVLQFLPLFESARFYNTLLARWVLEGGYTGRTIRPLIPAIYRPVTWEDRASEATTAPTRPMVQTRSSITRELRSPGKRRVNSRRRLSSAASSSCSVSTEATALTAATSNTKRAVQELRNIREAASADPGRVRGLSRPLPRNVLRAAKLMFDESPRGVDINVDVGADNRADAEGQQCVQRRAFTSNGRPRLLTTARATFDARTYRS